MSAPLRVLSLISVLLVGVGCAKKVAPISRTGSPVATLPALVRSPVVVLSDLQQQDSWQAFEANLFVGDIWLSGGYEYHVEHANQVRSVGVDLRDDVVDDARVGRMSCPHPAPCVGDDIGLEQEVLTRKAARVHPGAPTAAGTPSRRTRSL